MGRVTIPKGFDPNPKTHWYLVANRADATIYGGGLQSGFHFVKRMSWPGALHPMSAVEGEVTPQPGTHGHEAAAEQFAREITRTLDRAALKGEFSDLVVLAEPHFLGLLHRHFPKRIKDAVRKEIPREWRQGSDKDLARYLREKLA